MTPSLRIEIDVSVKDAAALWSMAAEQALGFVGMTIADVLDTIGARESPDIPACLAVLVDPSRFAGCAVTATTIAAPTPAAAVAVSGRRKEWTNGLAA